MTPRFRTCECGECKKCRHREYMNEWYRRPGNADKQREKQRRYGASHPDTRTGRKRDPEKDKVRHEAWLTLEQQPCEVCGEQRAHRHHDDYSKPLEVRWLCPRHHGEVHRVVF